ncbi:MAG: hypothetical protein JWL85_720, partial [Candidatus Saccharibacteria bacterium]|nr:hypothetical protein [Candidatus Saccharibacteria bacterium]
ITVTSKVQERLTFCVYTTGTGNNCTTKSGTAVTLGDDNGVLYPTGPFVDKSAKFSVSTNSTGSAIVRVKGPTLTSGGNTITSIGGTPTSVVGGGTEQFGFCAYESAASTPAMSIQTTYDGASGVPAGECAGTSQTAGTNTTGGQGTGAEFAYDTNTTDGTGSTYGDLLATKPAGDFSTVTMSFIGNISNSTEAGIYTTTLTFIATGTY